MLQQSSKDVIPDLNENSFSEVISKYLPYWPVFVLLIVLCISAAWFSLETKVPVYESFATLLIKDEEGSIDAKRSLEASLFGSNKKVENEIEILHSYTLAEEVVRNLNLYAPIYEKGKFHDKSAYLSSPVKIISQNPESLSNVQKVFFAFDKDKEEVVINGRSYALNQWVNTPYGVLKFSKNSSYQRTDDKKLFYFSLYSIEDVAAGIVNNLNISSNKKQASIIYLTIRDEVPKRGESILNGLITAYNSASVKDKSILASNTLSFVEERLDYVSKDLDSIESQLQQFKSKNQITDISAQGQIFLDNVGTTDQKLSEINMQLAVLYEVEKYVLGKGGRGNIVPATLGISDPVLSQLLQRLYDVELEYEKVKKFAPENNPMVITLVDEIAEVKPSILENINNQKRSLEAGKANLNQTSQRYSSILRTIPAKEQQLLWISRQQSIKNNIYTFLLQKREETALAYASAVADSRTIDKARTNKIPIGPNKLFYYLVATLAGVFLSICLIYLKKLFSNTISSRREIEKFTSLPLLGELIQDKSKSQIVISEGKRTFIAEQLRQLRTSLGFLGIGTRRKKILVTSSISGEGKSFVSANIGISLALMGKKVVLLELDLRKPKLSENLNINFSYGLSEYLIGDKQHSEIIKPTVINNNLFIIPAGTIPPNPSELILNGKLQELFLYLDDIFDYIIVDTSPVNPVTDANLIAQLCDATLFVVRQGITPKAMVKNFDTNNSINALKNVAIVFNGVKEDGVVRYGSRYRHEYAYIKTEKGKRKKANLTESTSI